MIYFIYFVFISYFSFFFFAFHFILNFFCFSFFLYLFSAFQSNKFINLLLGLNANVVQKDSVKFIIILHQIYHDKLFSILTLMKMYNLKNKLFNFIITYKLKAKVCFFLFFSLFVIQKRFFQKRFFQKRFFHNINFLMPLVCIYLIIFLM